MEDKMPWPPTHDNMSYDNIDVPEQLFNLLAYIITASSDPVRDGRLHVTSKHERVILSLAQDLIYNA